MDKKNPEVKSDKVYNVVILGPSSSGKTTIARYLAEKYEGRCISLDGMNASGRPINSILSLSNPRQFTKEELGVLTRRIMIKEAKKATKAKTPWFIDDIDTFILQLIPRAMRTETKIVCVLPTIDKIIKNVLSRNKEATMASEERYVRGVLKQLRNFIQLKYCHKKCDLEDIKKYGSLVISNKDIIRACEYDKIYYSVSEKHTWEEDTNDILERYGFKPLKSKKITYAIMVPIKFGQDVTILNDGKIDSIINRISAVIVK
jgi:adenylate kinase family enzyme